MESVSTSFEHPREERFFRRRFNPCICFGLGLLLFAMPFTQLKCGSVVMAENSGIGIAMGSPWKLMSGDMLNNDNGISLKKNPSEIFPSGPNILLVVCIVVALVGIIACFTNSRSRHMIGLCAGLISLVLLVAVIIQFRFLLPRTLSDEKIDKELPGFSKLIRIGFTVWYFLSMVAFTLAGFFNLKLMRYQLKDEMSQLIHFEFQDTEQPNKDS